MEVKQCQKIPCIAKENAFTGRYGKGKKGRRSPQYSPIYAPTPNAMILAKTIKSAAANAENNFQMTRQT
jgi:ribosomal protein L22